MNEAVSIKEAAKALNVSHRTVWNYIRKGKLDKVLVGNKAHVTKASIERLSQVNAPTVNESISISPGKVVVEVAYLEKLLTRLAQLLLAEKQYRLEHQADRKYTEQEALRGLEGVHVRVGVDPEAERLGLQKDQIKTEVELRLRKAGVRVLTMEESFKTPGAPWLAVGVTTVIMQDIPLVAYSIQVELMEMVMLARGFVTLGEIWNRGATGIVGTEKITEMEGGVGDKVDEFINDYLAANPKSQGSER